MPGNTTCLALPYPVATDPIDVHGDMQALAEAVDGAVCGITGKLIGEVFSMYVPPGGTLTVPPGALVLNGAVFNGTTYPALANYLGSTTLPDFRERFLRHTGGAFPGDGQTGGSADTPVVTHGHTLTGSVTAAANHIHSLDHNHGATATSLDEHGHTPQVGYVANTGAGSLSLVTGGIGAPLNTVTTATNTDIHNHVLDLPNFIGNTGDGGTHGHTNTFAVSNAGATGVNRNLPPFVNVTFLIQAA